MIINQFKRTLLYKQHLIPNSRFSFARRLSEPTNPGSILEMRVDVGDYAELERTFTSNDLKLFSEAI